MILNELLSNFEEYSYLIPFQIRYLLYKINKNINELYDETISTNSITSSTTSSNIDIFNFNSSLCIFIKSITSIIAFIFVIYPDEFKINDDINYDLKNTLKI